jgi:hypothetical protein
VKRLGIFNRELVQPEGLAHVIELRRAGLEHPQPHESLLAAARRGFSERDGARILTTPFAVMSAIDDHRGPFWCWRVRVLTESLERLVNGW